MTQTLVGLLEPDWIACLPKLLHVALCLHRRPVLRVREPLLGEFDELTGLVQISGALPCLDFNAVQVSRWFILSKRLEQLQSPAENQATVDRAAFFKDTILMPLS